LSFNIAINLLFTLDGIKAVLGYLAFIFPTLISAGVNAEPRHERGPQSGEARIDGGFGWKEF
jgi:hypothetical protein